MGGNLTKFHKPGTGDAMAVCEENPMPVKIVGVDPVEVTIGDLSMNANITNSQLHVMVDNPSMPMTFDDTMDVHVTNESMEVSGAVTVTNEVLNVAITNDPIEVTGTVAISTNPVPVSGSVALSGTPSVNVANSPAVTISGTPTVNVNGTVPVSGTVSANINGTVPVSGSVTATVSGTVSTIGSTTITDSSTGWSYGSSTPITNTSDVVLKAAASGLKNRLTGIQVFNSGATGSVVVVKDGSTVKWAGYLPGTVLSLTNLPAIPITANFFKNPIVGSVNTALNFACLSGSANVYVSAQGDTIT